MHQSTCKPAQLRYTVTTTQTCCYILLSCIAKPAQQYHHQQCICTAIPQEKAGAIFWQCFFAWSDQQQQNLWAADCSNSKAYRLLTTTQSYAFAPTNSCTPQPQKMHMLHTCMHSLSCNTDTHAQTSAIVMKIHPQHTLCNSK